MKVKNILTIALVCAAMAANAKTWRWQTVSGNVLKGDGVAYLYLVYSDNDSLDSANSANMKDVVEAFAAGTFAATNIRNYYGTFVRVFDTVQVTNGVVDYDDTTSFSAGGNTQYSEFQFVALLKVAGRDVLYISTCDGSDYGTSYTLRFELATAEYEAKYGYKGPGYYYLPASAGVVPGEPQSIGSGTMTEEAALAYAETLAPVPTAEQRTAGLTADDLQIKVRLVSGTWFAFAEPAEKYIPVLKTGMDDTQPVEVTGVSFKATIQNAQPGFFYGLVSSTKLDGKFQPAATFVAPPQTGDLTLVAPRGDDEVRFYKLSVSATPVEVCD